MLHQTETPIRPLPAYSSHGDRQGGHVSTTSSPCSLPIRTGGRGAMKQLETLLTFRIPILSSQNSLKTQNLVSVYASYQISPFFQGSFGTDSCFLGKPWCKPQPPLESCHCGSSHGEGIIPFQASIRRGREEQKHRFLFSSQVTAVNGVSSAVVKSGQERPT